VASQLSQGLTSGPPARGVASPSDVAPDRPTLARCRPSNPPGPPVDLHQPSATARTEDASSRMGEIA
jgi:hypothetical protein